MMPWMPANPCQPDCKQRDCYCPPNNRFGCPEYRDYQGGIDAQRKLLEYLIAKAKNEVIAINRREELVNGINPYELESMLKELEEK